MGKKAFDQKLARLDALRADLCAPEVVPALRAALREQGYLAGKAAAMAAKAGLRDLVPDLVAAFDRLFTNPAKSDPQCWGKNALAKALKDLGYAESAVYLRGAAHVQMESVWGGEEDTAATLRGACLLALVECRDLTDLELLTHLADALFDRKTPVRLDAVRAIAQVGREEGALLLRLKALAGDQEVEVTGACFAAILAIRAPGAVALVARFLKAESPDVRREAAAALGESRDPGAFPVLKEAWEKERDRDFRSALLSAMGVLRVEESIEFLLALIGRAAAETAEEALIALAPNRFSAELHDRVRVAVERTASGRLRSTFEEQFCADIGESLS